MYNTKELVKDKFWIVEANASKVGTIRKHGDVYEFFDQRTQTTTTLKTLNGFKEVKRNVAQPSECKSLNGFPTNSPVVVQVEHEVLPLFRKAAKGKTVYAAGYYILKYHGMGWQHAFCPKQETIDKYRYAGPYFTEWDMNLQLKKAKQDNE